MREYVSPRRSLMIGAAVSAVVASWSASAMAQDAPATLPPTSETQDSGGDILVTGSRIRRDPNDSALPLDRKSVV